MIPRVARVSINSLSLFLKKSHLKTYLKEYENTNIKIFPRNLCDEEEREKETFQNLLLGIS